MNSMNDPTDNYISLDRLLKDYTEYYDVRITMQEGENMSNGVLTLCFDKKGYKSGGKYFFTSDIFGALRSYPASDLSLLGWGVHPENDSVVELMNKLKQELRNIKIEYIEDVNNIKI